MNKDTPTRKIKMTYCNNFVCMRDGKGCRISVHNIPVDKVKELQTFVIEQNRQLKEFQKKMDALKIPIKEFVERCEVKNG